MSVSDEMHIAMPEGAAISTAASPPLPSDGRDLVLISWDGLEEPLRHLRFDGEGSFELLLFDYSGRAQRPEWLPPGSHWLSKFTHCKGEILSRLMPWLLLRAEPYRYIGLIDDDVAISIVQINQALRLGQALGSLCFSPTLLIDNEGYVPHMVSQREGIWRKVPWVDLKMSFVRFDLLAGAATFYPLDFSGYGVARFVHPYWARVLALPGDFHVFDQIVVRDCRPHRSGSMRFPNGLTGLQEAQRLHRLCLQHMRQERPDLLCDPAVRELLTLPEIRSC